MGKCVLAVAVSLLVAGQGCLDTTFIGTERLETSTSDDSDFDMSSEDESDTGSDTETDTGEACGLPSEFRWTSSAPLVFPPGGATGIKDPSAVRYNNQWLVFATVLAEPLGISYFTVSDLSSAGDAALTPVGTNENLGGYKAAPQLFFFEPQGLWYLVFQTQDPAYSTNTDPTEVEGWTAPTQVMSLPPLLTDNDAVGYDYWIICDDTECFMFFTGANDVLYRARTLKTEFPSGFGETEVVMEGEGFNLFEACNVYKVDGTDQYLLLVAGIGSEGNQYRFWTSDRLDGTWTPAVDSTVNTFASLSNVTGADWATFGIAHGEMLRENPDETMTIDTCEMQYLFSGLYQENAETDAVTAIGLLTDARQ